MLDTDVFVVIRHSLSRDHPSLTPATSHSFLDFVVQYPPLMSSIGILSYYFSFHRSERYPVSLPFCMCFDRCNHLVISKHGDIQRTCSVELTFACYANPIAQQISMLSRALLICLLAGSSAAFVEPPVTTVPRTVVRMSGGADAPPPPLKVS